MRQIVASFLLAGAVIPQTAAFQARTGTAAKPATGACSFLPRDLVEKVSGVVNKKVFDIPPDEEPVGKGTACTYADIILQIDVFTPQFVDGMRKEKEWAPVPAVGDAAFFRNNKNMFAELIGRAGARTFTIQMDIPDRGTAEGMKPNVITLANAIVLKLR